MQTAKAAFKSQPAVETADLESVDSKEDEPGTLSGKIFQGGAQEPQPRSFFIKRQSSDSHTDLSRTIKVSEKTGGSVTVETALVSTLETAQRPQHVHHLTGAARQRSKSDDASATEPAETVVSRPNAEAQTPTDLGVPSENTREDSESASAVGTFSREPHVIRFTTASTQRSGSTEPGSAPPTDERTLASHQDTGTETVDTRPSVKGTKEDESLNTADREETKEPEISIKENDFSSTESKKITGLKSDEKKSLKHQPVGEDEWSGGEAGGEAGGGGQGPGRRDDKRVFGGI